MTQPADYPAVPDGGHTDNQDGSDYSGDPEAAATAGMGADASDLDRTDHVPSENDAAEGDPDSDTDNDTDDDAVDDADDDGTQGSPGDVD